MKKSIRKTTGQSIEVDWSMVVTIGIDLGDRISQYVALDGNGEHVAEGRVPTTAEAFEKRFGTIGSKVMAIETGTHSPWVCRLLRRLGHRVTVANSRKLRLIYENRRKNDKVDAEYLARLVRVDPKLLSPVEHRGEGAQQHVAVLRSRDALVKTRSRLITHVRGAVKSTGVRVPQCSTEAFVKRARPVIPSTMSAALEPILTVIEQLSVQIGAFDRSVERLAKEEYRDAHVLMQIAGVGALTAVAYMATMGDPGRFAHSRTTGAWVGLVPGQNASSQSDPQQRITKEGDAYLRSLLINCAHYILGPFGPDCDLRRHGEAIAVRGGKNAKKRAVVAVARKLAVLLHRLWRTRAVYEPLRNAASTADAA
ncbi:MAG TPA: IS110 family transposase [Gemmatimonadaceae bacterium]|nr:IS110 family transposase [Gemmatimonadaceae bacterium]